MAKTKGYDGGKAALTQWRQELQKAARHGDVDGTTFRALLAITIGFYANGTGFAMNDDLADENDWRPAAVTNNIKRCLNSGWLIRKNFPRRGQSSDYEVAYPWETRGVAGGYPFRARDDRSHSDRTYQSKVILERSIGHTSASHRSHSDRTPSTEVHKGASLRDSPSPSGRDSSSEARTPAESVESNTGPPPCELCGKPAEDRKSVGPEINGCLSCRQTILEKLRGGKTLPEAARAVNAMELEITREDCEVCCRGEARALGSGRYLCSDCLAGEARILKTTDAKTNTEASARFREEWIASFAAEIPAAA